MTPEERMRRTDEMISRYKNGQMRYRTSATFNIVIQSLVNGSDKEEVIDLLCQIIDNQQQALQQQVLRHG